ncbi:MAG: hypothetical protein J3K34DRAFT_425409, partial [Monoraphidium minutum]
AGAGAQPRAMPKRAPKTCGGLGQKCCPECPPDTPLTACDQWSCSDGTQCYMFANQQGVPPDGGDGYPMLCLATPKTCGREGAPCCYNSDPASEDRCQPGLSCVAEGVIPYSSYDQYAAIVKDYAKTADPAVMGSCRKLTKADCGKAWRPCGAAAAKLGCDNKAQGCGAGMFCASPGDTRIGGPRCLPLPPKCGKLGGPCCPANKDGFVRETSFIDKSTPVPFCDDGGSMCVWAYEDYNKYGTAQFPESPGVEPYKWDGLFQRGYGRSRCIPLPKSCGQPGEACCASMMDQRISGLVHNRLFPYQPCNYRAAGRSGIYCKGQWQGGLLDRDAVLGKCTLNPDDCGEPGKPCCVNDIPEVGGAVGTCRAPRPTDRFYCTAQSICERCPEKLVTDEQRQNCFPTGGFGPGGPGGGPGGPGGGPSGPPAKPPGRN